MPPREKEDDNLTMAELAIDERSLPHHMPPELMVTMPHEWNGRGFTRSSYQWPLSRSAKGGWFSEKSRYADVHTTFQHVITTYAF
jgi:hypothetical protein